MTGFEIERRASEKNGKVYVTLAGDAVKDAIETLLDMAWEAAGGRGERPAGRGVLWSNHRGASISFEARDVDQVGNVPEADDADAKLARAWAEAIAEGRGALADLADWPGLQKMVATMLRPVKAAPAPKAPPAPPAPAPKAKAPAPKAAPAPAPFSVAARLGAAHGVTITRKGKRAA